MFTSDIDREKRRYIIGYAAATLFCLAFGLVYEYFSHGVVSYYMLLAFLIPMVGGGINLLSFRLCRGKGGRPARQLVNGGVIWLTAGCIFEGVLRIYGTTNRLVGVFLLAGAIQLAAAPAAAVLGKNSRG